MLGKKTFIQLTALLYIIAALHFAALYFFWYWSVWWYDVMMHVLGGLWIGGMALFLASKKAPQILTRFPVSLGVSLCAILIIGLLWEGFEWHIDRIVLARFANDLTDTLSDLGADIAGALAAPLFLSYRTSRTITLSDNTSANG